MIIREKTLLTIDHDTGLRHQIRDYFEDSGFKVLEAGDGRTGLDIFREHRPDVITVDLRLPEVDGLEVIRTIKEEAPDLPLVVVSGTGVLADAIEAMNCGAWEYVTKPISDMLDLEKIVSRVLERSRLLVENRQYQQGLEELVARKTKDLHVSFDKLKERELVFKELATVMVGSGSTNDFVALVRVCAKIFKTESAMVALLDGVDDVITEAIMINNEFLPNNKFSLHCTPCRKVLNDGYLLQHREFSNAFPHAEVLNSFGIEGYVGVVIKDEDLAPLGVLGIFSKEELCLPDYTVEVLDIIAAKAAIIIERKRRDRDEKKLQEKLQQSQKMEAIGTLAGGIAHDFNNILAVILGYTEMVVDGMPEDSAIACDLGNVLEAGSRAKDLVQQILSFSRQNETELIPLALEIVIAETIDMLRHTIPTTIEIKQDIAPDLGVVLADQTQVQQIIMNLGVNAFHAMEEQGGILSITLKEIMMVSDDLLSGPDLKPGRFIQLSVCDSGPGIGPDIMDRIFDPYFTTKAQGRGTGMGLAISQGIVNSYGGTISCYSELGKGTAFHVFLPVVDNDHKSEEILADEEVPRGHERLLFVDDEEMLVHMGRDMLENLGYDVTLEYNGLNALEIFKEHPYEFDLVITDQTMPGMAGDELAREMLKIRPDIPIILCTGYSTIVSEEQAKEIGIKEFVLKPLARDYLARLIRKVLKDNSECQ